MKGTKKHTIMPIVEIAFIVILLSGIVILINNNKW